MRPSYSRVTDRPLADATDLDFGTRQGDAVADPELGGGDNLQVMRFYRLEFLFWGVPD